MSAFYLLLILAFIPCCDLSPYKLGRNRITGSQFPPFKGCANETDNNQDDTSETIPTYTVNLDSAPPDRWTSLINDKKYQIIELINSIKNNSDIWFGHKVFQLVDKYMPYLTKTLPEPYFQELNGIALELGISIGEVTLFNVFYEFFSVCTSIILKSPDGDIFHGRNLDFGLFLGWNPNLRTWSTTEKLKPLVVQVNFEKNNKTLFSSIQFAGYIGILTAVKKDSFSLTVNERFKIDGGYIGIAEWIFGKRNSKWMGFLTREVLEVANTYKEAQKILVKTALVSPVYFILSGIKADEGCIITRGRKSFDLFPLGQKTMEQNVSWYLVQTNYDHWIEPPFYDDRRSPAMFCLECNGNKNPMTTLYNVLSTRPVLNKLTTYSAIMCAKYGYLKASVRDCEDPCWPW